MHVAIEGCSHGSLTTIYNTVAKCEQAKGIKVDLLLLCGDFQALRNTADFESLAVPDKFRELGSFTDYYSGDKVAPILTIVIGGNHEASRYMWELYHGGWLAPNIYYLGAGGSVMVNGIRISGLSGIYKGYDYRTGHWETTPYDRNSVKSAYHVREYDVWKMLQLRPRQGIHEIDLFMSHDWPVTITKHGDERALLRRKSFFTEEVQTNTLGSPPLLEVLHHLKPRYWFSAHLHVKFSALVDHDTLLALESVGWSRAGQAKRMTQRRWEKSPARDMGHGGQQDREQVMRAAIGQAVVGASVKNPDAIELDSDEDVDGAVPGAKNLGPESASGNPDAIDLDDMEEDGTGDEDVSGQLAKAPSDLGPAIAQSANPDVIRLDDEDDGVAEEEEDLPQDQDKLIFPSARSVATNVNPDFVPLEDDDENDDEGMPHLGEESVDAVERVRQEQPNGASGIIGSSQREAMVAIERANQEAGPNDARKTKFLALDKCGPGKDFLQILEIGPPTDGSPPRLHFDPAWLAVLKATHPWFSLQKQAKPFPSSEELSQALLRAQAWVDETLLDGTRAREFLGRPQEAPGSDQHLDEKPEGSTDAVEAPEEAIPDLHPLDIMNVQRFQPTAAAQKSGGDHPSRWYTNQQTRFLCEFLEIPNLINPAPVEVIRSA